MTIAINDITEESIRKTQSTIANSIGYSLSELRQKRNDGYLLSWKEREALDHIDNYQWMLDY